MKKLKGKIKIHNLMFIYIVTTIIVATLSLSKYVTTVTTDSIAKVAVMTNKVSVDMDLPMKAYPGSEPIICPIIITNKEGDQICDVSQKFTIMVGRAEVQNLPLVFELYKDQYCTEIIEKDDDGNYISEEFVFKAGVEETKTYYLKVYWPDDKKDEYLAFEIEHFSINVVGTQID